MRTVARLWPVLEIDLVQSNWSYTQALSLHLRAAPFQEIWFSTLRGLTSGNRPSPGNSVSSGDLISNSGRTIRSNAELIQALKLKNTPAGLGLDAFDIGAGGEIYSTNGQVVRSSGQLYAQFSPKGDYGLKAFYIWPSGEIWFTPAKGFQDTNLGAIQSGDLLSVLIRAYYRPRVPPIIGCGNGDGTRTRLERGTNLSGPAGIKRGQDLANRLDQGFWLEQAVFQSV
jgi:hypothetical protein